MLLAVVIRKQRLSSIIGDSVAIATPRERRNHNNAVYYIVRNVYEYLCANPFRGFVNTRNSSGTFYEHTRQSFSFCVRQSVSGQIPWVYKEQLQGYIFITQKQKKKCLVISTVVVIDKGCEDSMVDINGLFTAKIQFYVSRVTMQESRQSSSRAYLPLEVLDEPHNVFRCANIIKNWVSSEKRRPRNICIDNVLRIEVERCGEIQKVSDKLTVTQKKGKL